MLMIFVIGVTLYIMSLGCRIGVKIKDYAWIIAGAFLIWAGLVCVDWNDTLGVLMLGLGLCLCGVGVVGAIIDHIKWSS